MTRGIASLLSLPLLVALATTASGEPVRVWLDWPAGAGAPRPPVRICAGPKAAPPATCNSSVVTGADEVVLRLDPGDWRLRAVAEGFWSAPIEVAAGPEGAGARLTLWPASSIAGDLTAVPGQPLPTTLEAQFQSAAGADRRLPPVTGTAPCPVAQGRWRCVVPAGVLDVELRADGFVPHYAWDVRATARVEAALGSIALRRGASVAGWVMAADGTVPKGPCRVEVREGGAVSAAPVTAAIDAHGFFQIVGLPAGEHTLATLCPPLPPATAKIAVRPDAETRLPRPFVPLDIVVIPPAAPSGRPWRLDVFRALERTELAVLEPLSAQGRWFRHRVASIPHEMNVASEPDTYWLHRVAEVTEKSGTLTLTVPQRRIAGILQIGTRPVRGRLAFVDEASMLAGKVPVERMPRIPVDTRDDGTFEGALPVTPAADTKGWNIEVGSARPPIHQTLESVLPTDVRAGGVAWYELTLKPASIRGTVAGDDGRPEARANVRAESLESRWVYHDTFTSENGAFQFVGLEAGPYRVSAEGSAESQDVEVVEGIEQEVHLVRKSLRPFRGQVIGAGRPVEGAWVDVWRAPGVHQAHYITGADGRFEIEVPSDAAELGVTVRGKGYAFKMLRVPQEMRDALQIDLDPRGGRLVLDIPPEPPDQGRGLVVLVHNQSLEKMETLGAWGTDNGGGPEGDRIVLPQVEPGEYTLCRVPPKETPNLWNGKLPSEYCSPTERLDAGGNVLLKLPGRS